MGRYVRNMTPVFSGFNISVKKMLIFLVHAKHSYLRLFAVDVLIIQMFCTNDREIIIFERIFMIELFAFELVC